MLLDTESNGPEKLDEVWQAAWQLTDNNFSQLSSDGGYLAPTKRMKQKPQWITGLDRDTLLKLAEPAEGLYSRFLDAVRKCDVIIGHSIKTDVIKIVCDADRRCSSALNAAIKKELCALPCFDTAESTLSISNKRICRGDWRRGMSMFESFPGYASLVELADILNVERTDIKTHSADGDVELTRRCMIALREQHPELLLKLEKGLFVPIDYPIIY